MRSTLVGSSWSSCAVGCAHALRRQEAHGPGKGGSGGWIELTSRHFTLRTDLPPASGARRAGRLRGRLRDARRRSPSRRRAARPHRRRALQRRGRASASWRRVGAAGYFMPRQADDPDPTPTIAIHGRMLVAGTLVESTQRRFRHELTHRFIDHRLRCDAAVARGGAGRVLLDAEARQQRRRRRARCRTPRSSASTSTSVVARGRRLADDRVDLADVPTVRAAADGRLRQLPRSVARAGLLRRRLDLRAHDAERPLRLLAALPALPRPARRRRDAARGVARVLLGRAAVAARARLQALRRRAARDGLADAVGGGAEGEEARARARDGGRRGAPHVGAHSPVGLAREHPGGGSASCVAARAPVGDHASAELHYWSGLYALRWRHFEEAERELRAAVALEPTRARHWLALARGARARRAARGARARSSTRR